MSFQAGDFVTRRSYNNDIIFKIEEVRQEKVLLRGYKVRLLADAPLDDLRPVKENNAEAMRRKLWDESFEYLYRQQRNLILNDNSSRKNNTDNCCNREKPGSVLHIDGDKNYLNISLQNYKNLRIKARGYHVEEKKLPGKILKLLKSCRPDILVITGHDGLLNGRNYHTSQYFIRAVKIARSYRSNLDDLVIFAGACQSRYSELIESGANIASSPCKKFMHFLDPVMIAEKVAYTSIRKVLDIKDIINCTVTGEGGIGGVETRGKLRLCYP